jgi:hypothetical protein
MRNLVGHPASPIEQGAQLLAAHQWLVRSSSVIDMRPVHPDPSHIAGDRERGRRAAS